ncbi:hypothetical protein CPC08DRAFT_730082 [Agrocybe pediades]|nr:hypothetical protein CPC08DRAFT_730082 [Agrocybe pediades]
MTNDFPCLFPGCHLTFHRLSGRTRHHNTCHRPISPDPETDPANKFREVFHSKLNALPCDANGSFLPQFTCPPPFHAPDKIEGNDYHPFKDRLAFDWAHYHFVELQSSERKINKGLDLWLAAQLKAGNDSALPWSSVQEMYTTIDKIQAGDAPFETVQFKYTGVLPPNPPSWMTATYELCTRNSRKLLHNQLATSDFASDFSTRPYRQFNYEDDRVWSNLMSGDWAWNQADVIAEDPRTHGSMLVPIVAGSDKTTVSVATGHQEYHPVYQSPGNISNVARRSHSNSVLPVAFLPIPKTNKREREKPEYQKFTRQLYHACLGYIFQPLRQGMTVPDVARCPDGHYRHVIYRLGPYIANYPEQVWLAGIVQNWCPKCDAHYKALDENFQHTHFRSHERTDFIVNSFDPGTVWNEHGIQSDVVPFTHGFPGADIHTLLSPDLLHQLIKGTFKDHLVTWVNEYLRLKHGKTQSHEIIKDIDQREGRDFEQWTGDDSKALMKVYIAAIAGHVPPKMVKCLATFVDLCYIFRRNVISNTALRNAEALLQKFLELREVFIEEGVRASISLPRQHALIHYLTSIPLFGSPNGLCSSITESKHIKAVKEPWRRSNRFEALDQMLRAIIRSEKLATLRQRLLRDGFLVGSTAAHYLRALVQEGRQPHTPIEDATADSDEDINMVNILDGSSSEEAFSEEDGTLSMAEKEAAASIEDAIPDDGPPGISSIQLAALPDRRYPKELHQLSQYINEPDFPEAFNVFLYSRRHPNRPIPPDINMQVNFCGKIYVFHSATTRFYAPSDLCGLYGMYHEDKPGNEGKDTVQCALVSWYPLSSGERDCDTGMWTVRADETRALRVIPLKRIARGAHLLPKYSVAFRFLEIHK